MPIKTENKKNKGGKMKVKITKNNDENYWYNDRIGEVFEVEDTTYPLYYRANGRCKGCYIDKDDCEIIKENPLEGADKLSEQIIKNDWAKMPKVKEETVKEKQYVVTQDILGIKKEEITIIINRSIDDYSAKGFMFSGYNKSFWIHPETVPEFLQQGIIAEKKSKVDTIADSICNEYAYPESRPLKEIIIDALEKAGVK